MAKNSGLLFGSPFDDDDVPFIWTVDSDWVADDFGEELMPNPIGCCFTGVVIDDGCFDGELKLDIGADGPKSDDDDDPRPNLMFPGVEG